MTTPADDTLFVDFETRSVLDLKTVGLWNYARHPSTDVWCLSYAFNDGEPQLWIPGMADAPFLRHVLQGGKVVAHNAAFELAIWNEVMVKRFGWPMLKPDQTYCSMAMCYAAGLPGSLDGAAYALKLAHRKDEEGYALMLRMARPRRMQGATPIWWEDEDKKARLFDYCRQDVRVERDVYQAVPSLSDYERKVWLMDYAINQRGVAVDVETAKAGARMAEEEVVKAGEELNRITDGAVATPNALIPLKQWLLSKGVVVGSLDKAAVAALLAGDNLEPDVRRALTIRAESGKASIAKLKRIGQLAGEDGRLHGTLQYHGAGTGRWAARGVQVHNLVRDLPPPEEVEDILSAVREGKPDWIRMAYGPPVATVSRCLRSFFVAPEGQSLVSGDFSGVEARGAAWFCREEWKLQAFRDADEGKGPGIYELRGSKIFGIPAEKIKKKSLEYNAGKVCELAFGYQGGVGAARAFLPESMKDTPDDVLNRWKLGWRADHPGVVRTWELLEEAAINAVQNPGVKHGVGYNHQSVVYLYRNGALECRLPSGRIMYYQSPKILEGKFGPKLTYMTTPTPDMGGVVADPENTDKWVRCETYGGSLFENIIQAICRDLLVHVMMVLHEMKARIVMHVHDDVSLEVHKENADVARSKVEELMQDLPYWAKGFPLVAKCHVMQRYGL